MDGGNQEILYCEDDDEYRIYCEICDKLSSKTHFENHPKSGTHVNNTHKRQRLKIKNTSFRNYLILLQ